MIINLSKIDFGGVANSGGKTKPEETFDVQPTTSDQTITPTEGSVFSGGTVRAVTSDIDVNIVSDNIKEGVTILGVEGTLKEGITPAGTIAINLNGTYDVTNYASAEVNVGDTPDYRYMKGTVDRAGLKAIGWTDEDILTYEQNNPHFAWENDQYKVSDENKALYLLDDPNPNSYKDNPNIEYIPKKNMESYFAIYQGFYNMNYIKGIPLLNTSNVTDMFNMFANDFNLTTIPQLDTSNVTNMGGMFASCHNFTTIPQLDTSNVTNMNQMFADCYNLAAIPLLDTSKVTDMNRMFWFCNSLRNIPLLDTSNVTNMGEMFTECTKLTTIPLLNTSNVTDMNNMFRKCENLISIPQLDTSNVTNMSYMFNDCGKLTTIPQLDTSNVTNMGGMFDNCSNLKTIPQLNTSKVTNMDYMFSGWAAYSLTTVEGIDFSGLTSNLDTLFGWSSAQYVTRFIVNGKLNVSSTGTGGIQALTAIDYDSVKSILEAANRTDNTNEKTLAFNRIIADRDGEIAALVTSCTAKGWTITGLTIKPREDVILTCSDVVLTDGKVDHIPVTIDALNNWSVTREPGWLAIDVYDGSTIIDGGYGSTPDHWGDLTGQTAGINTANLKVSDFEGIVNRYGDLPEGIKLVVSFGTLDSNNAQYDYNITLERIDGQITTTLQTKSPNA